MSSKPVSDDQIVDFPNNAYDHIIDEELPLQFAFYIPTLVTNDC